MSFNKYRYPECMLPDGGQACSQYRAAFARIEQLEAEVAQWKEAGQMIVDAHDKAGPTTEHGLHCACMNLLAVLEADK